MATVASAVPGGVVDLALEGSTVVVTGADSGIGAATARQLGVAGAPLKLVVNISLLLSPVSSFMTGAVIPVDGGQVIPHA